MSHQNNILLKHGCCNNLFRYCNNLFRVCVCVWWRGGEGAGRVNVVILSESCNILLDLVVCFDMAEYS